MEELAKFLEENQIDASTLDLLYNTDIGSIYYLTIFEEDVREKWKKLRDLVEWTGRWPVILEGSKSDWECDENYFYAYPTKSLIEDALTFDLSSWFTERWEKARTEILNEEGIDLEEAIRELPGTPRPNKKQVVKKNPNQGWLLKNQATEPSKKDYLLALLPSEKSWYAPVLLRAWGYNDIPEPETHAAILKYWNELYGAELRGMSRGNTVELAITRPVQEWEQALELAKEQYAYCCDSWRPAARLIETISWYFWWD